LNRKSHNSVTKALFPGVPLKLVNAVNYELDKPSSWAGPSHRRYLHDPVSAGVVGASVATKMGLPTWMGVAAASAHLLEDRTSDKMTKVKIGRNLTLKKVLDTLSS
jgi:hypothetical protein